MPAKMWRKWLERSRRAVTAELRPPSARRRRFSPLLRLEELESRLTPSIAFLTTPTSGTAGQLLNPAVQVQVLNAGMGIPGEPVALTVASGPGSFTPKSTTSTFTDSSGTATFSNLVLNTAGDYTFQANDFGDLGGSSSPSGVVAVNAAPASQLDIHIPVSQITEGTPLSFIVEAADPFDNPASGATVHFSSSTAGVVLPPDYTFQASDHGEQTFAVTFTAAGLQTITATLVGSHVSVMGAVQVQPVPPGNIQLKLSATDVSIGQPITLAGTFTDPGTLDANTVVIAWGDGSANTTLVLPPQVRTFNASHAYTVEGDYFPTVFISNADGGTSTAVVEEQALAGPILSVADAVGQPGQSVSAFAADSQSHTISVTLFLSPLDLTGAGIIVAKLGDAIVPAGTDRATILSLYDIRSTTPEIGDAALVTFRFFAGPDLGQTVVLQFLNPATGKLQTFSPSNRAGSLTLIRQGDFILGSLFLDNTSTPTLVQLSHTVFTISVSVPSAAATAAVSASIASSNPNATAPVSTATFRSTSQLTLTLEPTQASQVSGGLSSFEANNSGGGGEATPDDAAAALYSFLVDEVSGGVEAIWPFGGDANLKAWIQRSRNMLPQTPASSAKPAPAAPEKPTPHLQDESLRDAADLLFRELASAMTQPPAVAATPTVSHEEMEFAERPSAPPSALLSTKIGRATILAGLAVAVPDRRKKADRAKAAIKI